MSLHACLHMERPPPCLPYRCLVASRRLVIGLHRDGLYVGAGDGARTRDSLLGRQELYLSLLLFFILVTFLLWSKPLASCSARARHIFRQVITGAELALLRLYIHIVQMHVILHCTDIFVT